MLRICTDCGIEKPIEEFYDNKERKWPICRICYRERYRDRSPEGREIERERKRRYRDAKRLEELEKRRKLRGVPSSDKGSSRSDEK